VGQWAIYSEERMSNMSYCRFQNTYRDLLDCEDSMNDSDLSPEEARAREKLLKLCQQIVREYAAEEA
jgi:hypothetical protein